MFHIMPCLKLFVDPQHANLSLFESYIIVYDLKKKGKIFNNYGWKYGKVDNIYPCHLKKKSHKQVIMYWK